MKVILTLLVILAPLYMAAARLLCPNVLHVSMTVACSSAHGTKFMYDNCIDAMQRGGIDPSPSHTEETTVYAILAANQAIDSYSGTLQDLRIQLQQNKSLSRAESDAYHGCMNDYTTSTNTLAVIVNSCLNNCYFKKLSSLYVDGIMSLENCKDRMLAPWMNVPPLYPKVERDRSKIVIAYMLGYLLDGL